MKRFAVVVLYRSGVSDDPWMTYTAYVKAKNALDARKAGAREAWAAQPPEQRGRVAEWVPLVVFEGHPATAYFAWQSPRWNV